MAAAGVDFGHTSIVIAACKVEFGIIFSFLNIHVRERKPFVWYPLMSMLCLSVHMPGWNPCKPYAEDAPVVVKRHDKVTNDAILYLPPS